MKENFIKRIKKDKGSKMSTSRPRLDKDIDLVIPGREGTTLLHFYYVSSICFKRFFLCCKNTSISLIFNFRLAGFRC